MRLRDDARAFLAAWDAFAWAMDDRAYNELSEAAECLRRTLDEDTPAGRMVARVLEARQAQP